jgi:hypothetical protein
MRESRGGARKREATLCRGTRWESKERYLGLTVDKRPIAWFWWRQRIALAAFASCGEEGAVPLVVLPGRARLPLPSRSNCCDIHLCAPPPHPVPATPRRLHVASFHTQHPENTCHSYARHRTIAIATYIA